MIMIKKQIKIKMIMIKSQEEMKNEKVSNKPTVNLKLLQISKWAQSPVLLTPG